MVSALLKTFINSLIKMTEKAGSWYLRIRSFLS